MCYSVLMEITVHSKERQRTYTRHFDHAEAKRLRKRGLSYGKIAEELGVSTTAIQKAINPDLRRRMDEDSRRHALNQRQPCKGGCGRLVWMNNTYQTNDGEKERSGYCRGCLSEHNAKRSVREDELRCSNCRKWKPDGEFPAGGPDARRGKRTVCTHCASEARRMRRADGRP